MKFAKYVFRAAGIYGLIVLFPLYFTEAQTGRQYPPPITHPEYYYGFVGVAVAWQVLFLILAQDPIRFRAMMIPSILEKAAFGIAGLCLHFQERIPALTFGFSMVDLALGILFLTAYLRTPERKFS